MARYGKVEIVVPGRLRELGSSVESRLDEAADYIEYLEAEISRRDERIEELEDQIRDLEGTVAELEAMKA